MINASVEVAAGVFVSLVTVVVTAVGFVSLDWRLALAFCVVFPIHAWGCGCSCRWRPRCTRRSARRPRTGTQTVLSVLHGTETVRAYGMADKQSATRRSSLAADDRGRRCGRSGRSCGSPT